jgi:hypothetical protein
LQVIGFTLFSSGDVFHSHAVFKQFFLFLADAGESPMGYSQLSMNLLFFVVYFLELNFLCVFFVVVVLDPVVIKHLRMCSKIQRVVYAACQPTGAKANFIE